VGPPPPPARLSCVTALRALRSEKSLHACPPACMCRAPPECLEPLERLGCPAGPRASLAGAPAMGATSVLGATRHAPAPVTPWRRGPPPSPPRVAVVTAVRPPGPPSRALGPGHRRTCDGSTAAGLAGPLRGRVLIALERPPSWRRGKGARRLTGTTPPTQGHGGGMAVQHTGTAGGHSRRAQPGAHGDWHRRGGYWVPRSPGGRRAAGPPGGRRPPAPRQLRHRHLGAPAADSAEVGRRASLGLWGGAGPVRAPARRRLVPVESPGPPLAR